MLRIVGEQLDLDALLATLPVKPTMVYRKGEPRSSLRPDGGVHEKSGAGFLAGVAPFGDFDAQKIKAVEFLTTHQNDLIQVLQLPGIEFALLDFSMEQKNDVVVQRASMGTELVKLAGAMGLDLEISYYPVADDEDDAEDCVH
jgi:hypothetical protein